MQSCKYLIQFTRFNSSVVLQYNEDGILTELAFDLGDGTIEIVSHFYKHLPFRMDHLDYYKSYPNVKVTQLFESLEFADFWNAYAHKVGNKKRAERLWEVLKPPERAKAIVHIVQYNQWLLQQRGIAKLYPETYLQQQRWNN